MFKRIKHFRKLGVRPGYYDRVTGEGLIPAKSKARPEPSPSQPAERVVDPTVTLTNIGVPDSGPTPGRFSGLGDPVPEPVVEPVLEDEPETEDAGDNSVDNASPDSAPIPQSDEDKTDEEP